VCELLDRIILRFVLRVALLGAVVIGSFALILSPLMLHPNGSGVASVPVVAATGNPSDSKNASHTAAAAVATTTDALGALGHVLHRVFPIARGLYEDKVANFWCATGALFRWKERFTAPALLRAAGVSTIAALLPASVAVARAPTAARFVMALGAQAFAFFLFSFQVMKRIHCAREFLLFHPCLGVTHCQLCFFV
jgi:hypothetical protein